jgi:hypothetical protein
MATKYLGGSPSTPTTTTQQQVGFAPQVAPYAEGVLGGAAAAVKKPYQSYADWAKSKKLSGDQVAKFNKTQTDAFKKAENLTENKYSTQSATGLAGLAKKAGDTSYKAAKFDNQFKAPAAYKAGQFKADKVSAPALKQYQMGPAAQVGTQSFTGKGTAGQYMDPYMQNVVDIQKREAQRQSGIQGTQQQAQAVQAGAFGGSRDAIMRAERERNLGQQMGDIQAQGSQAAYQQAQQQFNAEQNAKLAAQQSNQQAGLTVGQQNLASQLGTQQLGSGQNMQSQLANQQTGMTAQQLAEQSKQFGAGQGMTGAQSTAQYGLAGQNAGEQSNQFGANLGLQGQQTGMQGYGALGSAGQNLYGQTTGNIAAQNLYGTQQQQQTQNLLNVGYQNYTNEMNDLYKKVGFMSDVVRGSPVSNLGSSVYSAQPSTMNQVAGLATAGAGLYGAYNAANKAKGGAIQSKKPAGLAALILHGMA